MAKHRAIFIILVPFHCPNLIALWAFTVVKASVLHLLHSMHGLMLAETAPAAEVLDERQDEH
jgi:hypothetical protein